MPKISHSSSASGFFPAWRVKLAPMGRRSAALVQTVRQYTLAQIELHLAAALPASLLAQHAAQDYSRERIFTLARTVWCWLWQVLQAHTSCREVVRQVQALFALHDAGAVDESTGAYCQARRKLPQALLAALLGASFQSAERAAAPAPRRPLLGGRTIRVIDGSGARLADTPANRAAYPPSSSLPAGTGFPYLRIVVLFSLVSGALLAQATGSLQVPELRLWLELLPRLRAGEILLADRAYGLYVVAAVCQAAGVDLLSTVSCSRKVDFRKRERALGPQDALFLWKKSAKPSAFLPAEQWESLPQELTVRLLRVRLVRRGFRTETFIIVTTLLDPVAYPARELIAAHARRWRLEMTLDDLKTTLGMEQLRCQDPAMVQKELLVFLSAHNLIRWLMATAATQAQVELETISFKGTLDSFRQWSQALLQRRRQRRRGQKLWQQFLHTLAADALPFRPGRQEPRAVKKRSKYPHLNKPRAHFTPRWSRNQRRRANTAKRRAQA